MKRNRVIPLTLSALIMLAASSCSNPLKEEYSVPEHYDLTSSKPPLPDVTVSVDNEKLIADTKSECDIHHFIEKYCLIDPYGEGNLEEIAADIGIDFLRETEAAALYSVHKIQQGGLLYIFYANFPDSDYHYIVHWYYVQENLSSKDFEKIEEGSSLSDVKKIDPTTQIFENIFEADRESWEIGYPITWHYLTDGILEIYYTCENGKIRAMGKRFFDDFRVTQNASVGYYYDGRVLPIDKLPD